MPLQQHVLNWLYSVLTSEYHDVNRTYNDVAQALARYPTLSPRTDVYTYTSGTSALLLHISGTIPANFRGSTYRFPVSIWVSHAYPREPPMIYVTPTESMMVRPGQHVDPQGQIYHPYLVGWSEFWDKSTLQDFLGVLSDVFAKEPPVISRQQAQPSQSPQPVYSPPPVPPLPLEMSASPLHQPTPPDTRHAGPRPPPPPPKTRDEGHAHPSRPESGGPPIPHISSATGAAPSRVSRYDSAPPLPPQQPHGQVQMPPQNPTPPSQHPLSHMSPPQLPTAYQPSPQPLPPHHAQTGHWQPAGQPPPAWNSAAPPPPHAQHPPPQPVPAQARGPPPPALLDEPLTLEIPIGPVIAAPPIPPNPEKDALLRQLAQTLASTRQHSRQQNESSMSGLQAQRTAMLEAMQTLQAEIGQLNQMSGLLTSNTNILHEAMHKADAVIEGSRSQPSPEIDELLVAPTVVSNQLYTLVAEERALGDAIFMLGRAVERGRIPPALFAKMTRSLAREWYLKKALVRKIGDGMGLAPA